VNESKSCVCVCVCVCVREHVTCCNGPGQLWRCAINGQMCVRVQGLRPPWALDSVNPIPHV
jgi:hypothetical protein